MNSELWSSYVGQKLHGLLFPCKFRRIKGKACHSSKIVIITPLEMIHSPAHMESGFFQVLESFGKFQKWSETPNPTSERHEGGDGVSVPQTCFMFPPELCQCFCNLSHVGGIAQSRDCCEIQT